MIAVFNHFLSQHGFFLSIGSSHPYHLTPSSRRLPSHPFSVLAPPFHHVSPAADALDVYVWNKNLLLRNFWSMILQIMSSEYFTNFSLLIWRTRRHRHGDLCCCQPELVVRQQNSDTSQLLCFISSTKKGYCSIKTANLLQSSADDFLLHMNCEWLIIRPVRRLKFLIRLITGQLWINHKFQFSLFSVVGIRR